MISVVIPLYNKEKYISKAIQSVLDQTFTDFELIIVNDGSTDDGPAKVRRFTDHRIRMIDQPNAGVSIARNNGVNLAKYDYIAFLDADDWWHPDFLLGMKKLIDAYNDAAIYGCNYFYVKNRQNRISKVGIPESFEAGYINYFKTYANTFTVPFNCSFVVVNRQKFNDVGGFNPKLKFGEDFDLWVRMALKNKVAYQNKPLAYSNQDVQVENRALGFGKLYNKEHHCIFNFGFLKEEEQRNSDLKKLMDGLKLRSLINYRLQRKYTSEIEILFKNINWKTQPAFYRFVYRYPIVIVQFFYASKKLGSVIKQSLIKQWLLLKK